jgi:hypothetical protein
LKVEITVDEPVLLPAQEYPILHSFAEPFQANVRGYALAEIVAEKLRALLQSQAKLADRGWGASRVCRDYYDLWYILSLEKLADIPDLVAAKCSVRGIRFGTPADFVSPNLIETARREWNQQLSPFIPAAPAVAKVLGEVQALILALFKRN